jgi:hypothetical protein
LAGRLIESRAGRISIFLQFAVPPTAVVGTAFQSSRLLLRGLGRHGSNIERVACEQVSNKNLDKMFRKKLSKKKIYVT